MSAWRVSKHHIDCLVTALIKHNLSTESEATEHGKMLWRENYRSVNYRYHEKEKIPLYRYKEYPLTDGAVLKQIDCYIYQSAEHPGWKNSKAKNLVHLLYDEIAYKLLKELVPEYGTAPWGIP